MEGPLTPDEREAHIGETIQRYRRLLETVHRLEGDELFWLTKYNEADLIF